MGSAKRRMSRAPNVASMTAEAIAAIRGADRILPEASDGRTPIRISGGQIRARVLAVTVPDALSREVLPPPADWENRHPRCAGSKAGRNWTEEIAERPRDRRTPDPSLPARIC